MDYQQLTVTLKEPYSAHSEIVCSYLADYGFTGFQEEDNKLLAFIPDNLFHEEEIEALLQKLVSLHTIEDTAGVEWIQDQNWNSLWERNYFQPIAIQDKVYVRGSFHEKDPAFETEIIIDPKMSFGTGHHQTTRMILEELIALDCSNKTVMDMGTGTGILALYAAIKGAAIPVYAVDIDSWSVDNAIENAEINGLTTKLVIKKGDVRMLKKLGVRYDVFIANINLGVLLDDIDTYLQYIPEGGSLLLSGFLETDVPKLVKHLGKEPVSKRIDGEWAMLRFIC
jgi:ribosomal protein L11 methyltransferase